VSSCRVLSSSTCDQRSSGDTSANWRQTSRSCITVVRRDKWKNDCPTFWRLFSMIKMFCFVIFTDLNFVNNYFNVLKNIGFHWSTLSLIITVNQETFRTYTWSVFFSDLLKRQLPLSNQLFTKFMSVKMTKQHIFIIENSLQKVGQSFFHLSRQTTMIKDLLVQRQFSLVSDKR
jgi:hypothetical protein